MLKKLAIGTTLLCTALLLTGCNNEGPAEKAGKKLDATVEKVKDKLDQRGPAEKMGEDIDDKVEKLRDE